MYGIILGWHIVSIYPQALQMKRCTFAIWQQIDTEWLGVAVNQQNMAHVHVHQISLDLLFILNLFCFANERKIRFRNLLNECQTVPKHTGLEGLRSPFSIKSHNTYTESFSNISRNYFIVGWWWHMNNVPQFNSNNKAIDICLLQRIFHSITFMNSINVIL